LVKPLYLVDEIMEIIQDECDSACMIQVWQQSAMFKDGEIQFGAKKMAKL